MQTCLKATCGYCKPSHCPYSTHSLPQSNLAVMCCLTSLKRSWVRWPTSTCLLRSKISFITCQSRWNKSPSFFWRFGKGEKRRGGWKRNEKNSSQRQRMKGKFIISWRQNEDDRRKGTDKEIKIYSCVNAATQKHKWKHEKWRNAH